MTQTGPGGGRRLLITAGPTHEPIDAVRFIGNRSSGRLGSALATEAASRDWAVTLLMGPGGALPTALSTTDSKIQAVRFRTAADLQGLLKEHAPRADVLVMAAAVADFRPKAGADVFGGKFRRKNAELALTLEPTPDLLAEVAAARRPDQLMVGFALDPRDEMMSSAREKLERKRVDLVVANPLETMDSETIEAVVIGKDGFEAKTAGAVPKTAFAPWLMGLIESQLTARAARGGRA
jgi:phosphopantothenoylcysteine decarboxylase/phosphopantothenate--cysteine ligase